MSVLFKPDDVPLGVELAKKLPEFVVNPRRDMRAVGSDGRFFASSNTEHDQPIFQPHLRHLTNKRAHSLFDGVPSFLAGAIEHFLREYNPNAGVGA